jgi:hypothetical protein
MREFYRLLHAASSTGLCNKEPRQQGRHQHPAPKALAAGSMPAKDFGSASAIDHIESREDLCETKPILPGPPAHSSRNNSQDIRQPSDFQLVTRCEN